MQQGIARTFGRLKVSVEDFSKSWVTYCARLLELCKSDLRSFAPTRSYQHPYTSCMFSSASSDMSKNDSALNSVLLLVCVIVWVIHPSYAVPNISN